MGKTERGTSLSAVGKVKRWSKKDSKHVQMNVPHAIHRFITVIWVAQTEWIKTSMPIALEFEARSSGGVSLYGWWMLPCKM